MAATADPERFSATERRTRRTRLFVLQSLSPKHAPAVITPACKERRGTPLSCSPSFSRTQPLLQHTRFIGELQLSASTRREVPQEDLRQRPARGGRGAPPPGTAPHVSVGTLLGEAGAMAATAPNPAPA
jgi:hypothetical protein